jgi:hypothetical protein
VFRKEAQRAALWRRRAKAQKRTILKSSSNSENENPTIHKDHKEATRFEKLGTKYSASEVRSQRHKSTRTSLRVCCVSHYLRCLSSLSLFISLAQTREEQERRLFGGRGTKAKPAAHSVVAFRTRRKRNKIDFPGDGISDLGKRERETDELFL